MNPEDLKFNDPCHPFQNDPITEAINKKMIDDAKKLEEKIYNSLTTHLDVVDVNKVNANKTIYADASIKANFDHVFDTISAIGRTADITSIDYRAMDQAQAIDMVINQMPTEDLIKKLIKKMQRTTISADFHQAVQDYIIRNTISIFGEFQSGPPLGAKVDWLDVMIFELLHISGISKVQVLLDEYPESVSMILKVNMNGFLDEEVQKSMGLVDQCLKKYKPKELQKLEVIYHNKVVY